MEEIESRLEVIDAERAGLLKELRDLRAKARLIQYAGRLQRAFPGKENVVIYDYLDEMLPLACRMYRKRLPAYRSMGYVILNLLKASAFQASSHRRSRFCFWPNV